MIASAGSTPSRKSKLPIKKKSSKNTTPKKKSPSTPSGPNRAERAAAREKASSSNPNPLDDPTLLIPSLGRIPQPARFSACGSICNGLILLYQALVKSLAPSWSKATIFLFCVFTSIPLVFTVNMGFIYGWQEGQTWWSSFRKVAAVPVLMALMGASITKLLVQYTGLQEVWSFLGWAGIGNVDMVTMASCGIANFVITKALLAIGGSGGKEKKA